MEKILNIVATLTANITSAPAVPTDLLTNMKNAIINQFSINSKNNVSEINSILTIIENNYGQLCDNWHHEERQELITVYLWHVNHGLTIPSELVADMKKIATEIEKEVTKKLIGSITLNQLSGLLG